MAMQVFSNVNYNGNQLQNFVVQVLGTDPSSPLLGQMWFNSVSNHLKVYDGNAVRSLFEVAVNTYSDLAAPTSAVNLNGQTLTNVATPVNPGDVAIKSYVDAATIGLNFHQSVVAASTANVAVSTGLASGQVIDGVTLATGNRVLLKNQSTASQNGIYVVPASGAASYATDMTNGGYTSGAICFVEEGTTNAGAAFVVQTQGTITPGTTAATWVQFSGGASYTAGSGLTLTGNAFAVATSGVTTAIANNKLIVNSSSTAGQALISSGTVGNEAAFGTLPVVGGGTGATTPAAARTALAATGKYTQTIGDGSTTSIKVTHNLNTSNVVCSVYSLSSPYQQIMVETQVTDANDVTFVFATAPASNSYSVTVVG